MPTRQCWSAFAVSAIAVPVVAVWVGMSAGTTAIAARQETPKQLLGTLHVTDKKDVPLTDVTASELEVTENGKSRPIDKAELDTRPLAVALVLDNNSELSSSFMQSVVPAGVAVVKALPPGTTIDIWTTADRPTNVGKALPDPAAAEAALKGVAALGTNTVLNTIADASKALPSDDGHRTAVIVMTTGTLGDSGGYGYEQALKVTSMRPTFVSLEFVTGKPDARAENELAFLAKHSGGFFERVLAITAFAKRVPFLVAMHNAKYRVSRQPSMDPRKAQLDIKCSRKGTKVVAAQRLSAVW